MRKRRTFEIEKDALRDCPPVTTIFISKRGGYIHGLCKKPLEYLRTEGFGRTSQAVFACKTCLETRITIPLLALSRVVRLGETGPGAGEVRTGGNYGNNPNHRQSDLLLLGDSVPSPPKLLQPRLLDAPKINENTNRCRTCGLNHLLLPAPK